MRSKIRGSILISVVLTSILLTACSTSKTSEPGMGNTNANISNGGMSVLRDDWLYFANAADNFALYKIKTDGTGEGRVSDDKPMFLNSFGDWLYFSGREDLKLYKIKPDGSERILLSDEAVINVMVADGWIYYKKINPDRNESPDADTVGGSEYGRIFKIRTDGTGRQMVSGERIDEFNIAGGWIYYSGSTENDMFSSGSKLYRMKPDGSANSRVGDMAIGRFIVLEDYIYYLTAGGDDPRLWKMKLDGTGAVKLTDEQVSSFNPRGGWIYYGNVTSEGMESELKKMKLDGTEATVINEDDPFVLNVHGDMLVYLSQKRNTRLKQIIMRSDGTGRRDYVAVIPPIDPSYENMEILQKGEEVSSPEIKMKVVSSYWTNLVPAVPDDLINENSTFLYIHLVVTNISSEIVNLQELIRLLPGEATNGAYYTGKLTDISSEAQKDEVRFIAPTEKSERRMSLEPGETKDVQIQFTLAAYEGESVLDLMAYPVYFGLFSGSDMDQPVAVFEVTPDEVGYYTGNGEAAGV